MSLIYYNNLLNTMKRMKDIADGKNHEFAHGIIENIEGWLNRCVWTTSSDTGACVACVHNDYSGSSQNQPNPVTSFNDTSSDLEYDLDNIKESEATNKEIADCIIKRAKECIEGCKIMMMTSGSDSHCIYTPSHSDIIVPHTFTSDDITITITNDSLEQFGLKSDFENIKENDDNDSEIADAIMKRIKNMINGLQFDISYTNGCNINNNGPGSCSPS